MAIMMRTMLEVADNSGARKLQTILPLGGSTGLRAGLGDVVTACGKGSFSGWPGQEGVSSKSSDRAHPQGISDAAMALISVSIRMRRC